MIHLFNIPNYKIDTSKYSNLLHDGIVTKFEQEICNFVGANYGSAISSATNAIFLSLYNKNINITIPSMIPPVVLNAIIQSNNTYTFKDDTDWVGNSYILHDFGSYKIIDSAQKIEKDQFLKEANDQDLMIFSFYPTKPIGSCDGGMIVSNTYSKITWFKTAVLNGTLYTHNNWNRDICFPGWKMYMNTIQADIAYRNFKKLNVKYKILKNIRNQYNDAFGINQTSNHLYRIICNNNTKFIDLMKKFGIICGVHYKPMHLNSVYKNSDSLLCNTENLQHKIVSIPFHEELTEKNINKIIKYAKKFQYIH